MTKTNFEKIKEMSIDEFSDFVSELNFCSTCPIEDFCDNQPEDITCKQTLHKWLESEYEE